MTAETRTAPAPQTAFPWRCAYLLVLVALALATTRPLATRLSSAVPIGPQPAATVPLFNVWTVWWNADRVQHGLARYWHAPIFHPTAGTFAFSEAQPPLMLLAPLTWITSPTTVYNVYLLASLVLNGWFGCNLLRQLGHVPWLACIGGLLCLLLPFVHWQIAVLQLIPIWGVLWTLQSLDQFAEEGRLRTGVQLGAAFGLTYLLCNYYGLFLSVLLAVSAPWLVWRRWRQARTWAGVVAAGATAALLTGPVVWAQLHYLMQHQFGRDAGQVTSLSTTWRDFVLPWGFTWLPTERLLSGITLRWRLSPGWFTTALALVGLAFGLAAPSRRRRIAFWGLLLLASLLLSSAGHLQVRAATLQSLLVAHWPGFAQIRTPYRFAMFAQLAAVVLAVEALTHVHTRLLSRLSARTRWRHLACILPAGLGLLAMIECPPRIPRLADVPQMLDAEHWANWLRDQTPTDAVVVSIPFVHGTSESEHEVSTRAMFFQMTHHRKLAEGYSGFFPQLFRELRLAMEKFPDEASQRRLDLMGVRFVVVDHARLSPASAAALPAWSRQLALRYSDTTRQVSIYELIPGPSLPAAASP